MSRLIACISIDVAFVAVLAVAALVLVVTVPPELASSIPQGLVYPALRYGTLLPLVAFGLALAQMSAGQRALSLIALAIALGAASHETDAFLYAHSDLLSFVVRFPVVEALLGALAGISLLMPARVTRWYVPLAAIPAGVALGAIITLSGVGDISTAWFAASADIGALAIVLIAATLGATAGEQRLVIPGKILGSWLLAASCMLGALAAASRPPPLPTPSLYRLSPDIDMSRQP